MKSTSNVDERVKKLNRAFLKTRELLVGKHNDPLTEGMKLHVIDLEPLGKPLSALSAELDFDCLELAKILVSTPTAYARLGAPRKETPVRVAASWLREVKSGKEPQLWNGSPQPIYDAIKSGDTSFFRALGKHLEKPAGTINSPVQIQWTLVRYWAPAEAWPGLAYCTNAARMEFCKAQLPRVPSKQYFDQLWRRDLGLQSARKPFVSKILKKNGKVSYS